MECTGCSLCLETITNTNFVLEEFHKNMLQILIPAMDWNNVLCGQPTMCQKCSENLQVTYLFKSSCLDNNEKMKVFKKLDETLPMTSQKCCLCCEGTVFEDLAGSDMENLKEMAYRCFPQLMLSSDNLGSCEKCLISLRKLDSFINSCLRTEENVKNYCSIMNENCKDFNLNEYIQQENSSTISAKNGKEPGKAEFNTVSEGTETAALDDNPNSESGQEPNGVSLAQDETDGEPHTKDFKQNSARRVKVADSRSGRGNKLKQKLARNFHCDQCDYVAKHKSALVSHMVRHRDPTKTKMHRCAECGHETKRIADLRWHMIIHKAPEEVKLYYCADCSYKTKRKADLKQHVVVHRPHTFKCPFCPYETKHRVYLDTVHALLHKDRSEVKTYKCESCSYETINKTHLKIHSKVHRDPSDLEKFRCNWCDFETTYKQGMRVHQSIHKCRSELEKYKCNFCEYEGTRKGHLREHMLRHVVSTVTYDCGKCSYKAKRKKLLVKHMQIHKKPSEIRMFECDMCTYRGRRKDNLKKHYYSHVRRLQAKKNKKDEIKKLICKIRSMTKT